MTALGDYRSSVADKIRLSAPAGVTVTTNPAANPPFILVDLVFGETRPSRGAWGGTLPIKCVVAAPGDAAAAVLMESMCEAVLAALGWAPFTPSQYRPNADTTLPMYELTYPATIPDPNC